MATKAKPVKKTTVKKKATPKKVELTKFQTMLKSQPETDEVKLATHICKNPTWFDVDVVEEANTHI